MIFENDISINMTFQDKACHVMVFWAFQTKFLAPIWCQIIEQHPQLHQEYACLGQIIEQHPQLHQEYACQAGSIFHSFSNNVLSRDNTQSKTIPNTQMQNFHHMWTYEMEILILDVLNWKSKCVWNLISSTCN